MFTKSDPEGYAAPLPGIRMKTLCYGERTLMTEFLLAAGHDLPMHTHPYEQTGYLVSGCIRLRIAHEEHDVMPGDSWCMPSGVLHGAHVIKDSIAIEVFSPVREDYLPK